MTLGNNSPLESARLGADIHGEVSTTLYQGVDYTIPVVGYVGLDWLGWGGLGGLGFLLQDEVAEFLVLYLVVVRKLAEDLAGVHAALLVEMAPFA